MGDETLRQAVDKLVTNCATGAAIGYTINEIMQAVKVRDTSRDQQIALEAEIKIHDEYWHSQKYVEEHGIGSLALANKEATELKLRSLKQPQGNTLNEGEKYE